MPFLLTDTDVAILNALLKDGRKSFRQISRETGISTPTVKAKYDRLVNIGFIKSVSPILDFKKVDYSDDRVINNIMLQATKNKIKSENKIKKGMGDSTKVRFLFRSNFRQDTCIQIRKLREIFLLYRM